MVQWLINLTGGRNAPTKPKKMNTSTVILIVIAYLVIVFMSAKVFGQCSKNDNPLNDPE